MLSLLSCSAYAADPQLRPDL